MELVRAQQVVVNLPEKRQAAGKSSMKAGVKKRSSAYEKRERLRVNIIVF